MLMNQVVSSNSALCLCGGSGERSGPEAGLKRSHLDRMDLPAVFEARTQTHVPYKGLPSRARCSALMDFTAAEKYALLI